MPSPVVHRPSVRCLLVFHNFNNSSKTVKQIASKLGFGLLGDKSIKNSQIRSAPKTKMAAVADILKNLF